MKKHIKTLKGYNHFLKHDDPLHLPDCQDVTEALEYAISEAENKHKLLLDFFLYFRENGEKFYGISIEELVKRFLDSNSKEDESRTN